MENPARAHERTHAVLVVAPVGIHHAGRRVCPVGCAVAVDESKLALDCVDVVVPMNGHGKGVTNENSHEGGTRSGSHVRSGGRLRKQPARVGGRKRGRRCKSVQVRKSTGRIGYAERLEFSEIHSKQPWSVDLLERADPDRPFDPLGGSRVLRAPLTEICRDVTRRPKGRKHCASFKDAVAGGGGRRQRHEAEHEKEVRDTRHLCVFECVMRMGEGLRAEGYILNGVNSRLKNPYEVAHYRGQGVPGKRASAKLLPAIL